MQSLNKVQLIGNLGDDPKIIETDNKGIRLSLATNEDYTNKQTGEKISRTGWHTLTAWNKTAEMLEKYTKKGDRIYIEGKLIHTSWNDKNGEKRYGTEIRVLEFMNLTKKEEEKTES